MYKTKNGMSQAEEFIAAAKAYMTEMERMPKAKAAEISRESLIRCGVLNPDGTSKKNIVTMSHCRV